MRWKDEVISKLSLIEELLSDMHADIAYIKNLLSPTSKMSRGDLKSDENSLLLDFLRLELSEIKFLLNRIISLQLKREKEKVELVFH